MTQGLLDDSSGQMSSNSASRARRAVETSPGRKTTSGRYKLHLSVRDGSERWELHGTMVAMDEPMHNLVGGPLSAGTVTGTCSDASLVLLIQWHEKGTSTSATAVVERCTGCTVIHAAFGHRLDGQFCPGDR